jgi:hypothetical protein
VNTTARTSAITTSAAISSTRISLFSSSVRPSTTTGTPLTRYEPLRRRNASSSIAERIRSIASARSDSLRSGRRRTDTRALSFDGKRYENRDLGVPSLNRESKITELMKVGFVSDGRPVCP